MKQNEGACNQARKGREAKLAAAFIFFGSCDLATDIAGSYRSHRARARSHHSTIHHTTMHAPRPMSSTMSPPTCSSPKGDDDASSKDDSHPSGAENKGEGAGGSAKHQLKDEKASSAAINKHEDADDDDEHDWHSAMFDEEYLNDDEYSYGDDDHDEYSISDYIQDEIERQLTEEIDAALQREIDMQLDRAMEECERELDRQLEEEIGRSLSQSLQIGDGSFAGRDYRDVEDVDTDDDRHDHCSSTDATTSKGRAGRTTAMVHGIASAGNSIIEPTGNGPKDRIADAKEKGGEDDADLDLPADDINKLPSAKKKKNEGNSNSAKSDMNRAEAAATSVVDVNRAIQSVIDSHKIR